jgi:hypothetical protein
LAASPDEEFQFTNLGYEIVDHKGRTHSGSVSELFGAGNVFFSDPQVMWDPSSNRFYFSIFENRGSTTPDEGIAWGFSKNARPTGPSDVCTYFSNFNYGATSYPDRESLGDTSDFLLIGSDRFSTEGDEANLGSDLAWISKPAPTEKGCPSLSSFESGIQHLYDPHDTSPYAPTPAKQVDPNPTGWVAAVPVLDNGVGTSLSLWRVTRNPATGGASISASESLPVPSYEYPPYATQAGRMKNGERALPLQTRVYLTQVIMAYDPRVGHPALWTAHTVLGGAGDATQWFEINPWNDNLDQSGIIKSRSLNVFNATISPDRVVKGRQSSFGDSAIMTVNTSSRRAYTAIQMLSLVGGQSASPMVIVTQSTGPYSDFTCFEPGATYCRWGDYSGSVPDPAAPVSGQVHGRVWLTNQWNLPDIDDETPTWQTTIWQAQF